MDVMAGYVTVVIQKVIIHVFNKFDHVRLVNTLLRLRAIMQTLVIPHVVRKVMDVMVGPVTVAIAKVVISV